MTSTTSKKVHFIDRATNVLLMRSHTFTILPIECLIPAEVSLSSLFYIASYHWIKWQHKRYNSISHTLFHSRTMHALLNAYVWLFKQWLNVTQSCTILVQCVINKD